MIDLHGEAGREVRRHMHEAIGWITNVNRDFQDDKFRYPKSLSLVLGLAEDELRLARMLLESQD